MAIATIECTCRRCGNKFIVRKSFRNCREAESWEDWANAHKDQYDLCDTCYQVERVETAVEKNQADGMPYLTGSPKQIAWAEKIREKAIADFQKWVSQQKKMAAAQNAAPEKLERFETQVAACMDVFRGVKSASEWIDLRDKNIVRWVAQKIKDC